MTDKATITKLDQKLLARLDPEGKLNLAACLQCGRCSSGCTMRTETDILPHQLNRMVMLGLEDRILASNAIWTCASCHTCVSRCPMKVDTPALIDKLRALATAAPEDAKRIRIFNDVMLGNMRRFGRVYELGMMSIYKMRSRDFFSDLKKFPTMLRKGKMKLMPPSAKGRSAAARIFDRTRGRAAARRDENAAHSQARSGK
jgi:heterodisulfide reductase subunit C